MENKILINLKDLRKRYREDLLKVSGYGLFTLERNLQQVLAVMSEYLTAHQFITESPEEELSEQDTSK